MRLVKILAVLMLSSATLALSQPTSKDLNNEKKNSSMPLQGMALSQDCGGTLQPQSLSYVCDRITSASLTTECFAAGNGRYLNECALGACDRYTSAELTIECVRAIADRDYSVDEVLACDRMTDAHETTRCFAVAGRYVGRHGQVNVHEVRRYVIEALDYLRSGRNSGADLTLQELLEYLRNRK